MLVHLARRHIVVLSQTDIEIPLVIAEIKIRLSTIIQHVHLAMLCWGHGTSINVHVRVNLDGRDFETSRLEYQTRA